MREAALVGFAVLVYFGVRGLTEGRVETAFANARELLRIEEALGVAWEVRIQATVVAHERGSGDPRVAVAEAFGATLKSVCLVALLAEAGAELFNRACFNFPTLGDLYKYAAYDAIARREAGIRDEEGKAGSSPKGART